MKEYVLSVAGMAILTAVVSVLIGEKKYGKTVNGVLKLCMLLTMISPIFQYMGQDTTTFFPSQSIFGQDYAYINNSYSLALETQLKQRFDVTAEVEVQVESKLQPSAQSNVYADGIQSVKIYIFDFGMNDREPHINIITQIAEEVKTLCNCQSVEVYDGS